jgi:hypothetical protein
MRPRKKLKSVHDEPIVDPSVLESAKHMIYEPRPTKTKPCRVCGSDGATEHSEGLCWVCRRLKISAWREVEQQLPLSE